MDDDDYFSDDFDSLPPGTLYELEQNAYQATQAPATQASVTQHHVQPIEHAHLNAKVATPAQQSTTLRPPPRLHTGLTNDYLSLEVGEPEAEVHNDFENQPALHQGSYVLVAQNEWPGPNNGTMGDDAMELDNYDRTNAYPTNANLEQVILTW
jgi:hypothetical protein